VVPQSVSSAKAPACLGKAGEQKLATLVLNFHASWLASRTWNALSVVSG